MNIIDFFALHWGFMFGIGIFEILLIFVVALIFLGDSFPKTIIDLARIIRQLKNSLKNAQEKIEQEINQAEQKYPRSEVLDITPKIDLKSEQCIDQNYSRPSDNFNNVEEMFSEYAPDSKKPK